MQVAFTKMQGAGNDFVVFDAVRRRIDLNPEQIRRIADRRFGVGCDQVLLVEPASQDGMDFRYRIFNADGGEVEQCGNGARCLARFMRDKGLTEKDEIALETRGGVIYLRIEPDGQVTINMGSPCFEPEKVPFKASARATVYDLEVRGQTVQVSVLSVGNPHAVQIVPDIDRAPVATQGPLIERHPRFPERVNAGYTQIVDRTHIRLRVYERGAGETLACGTGACAAVVVGRHHGLLDECVEVSLRGGKLQVCFTRDGEPVWLTGPAAVVFEGTLELDAL